MPQTAERLHVFGDKIRLLVTTSVAQFDFITPKTVFYIEPHCTPSDYHPDLLIFHHITPYGATLHYTGSQTDFHRAAEVDLTNYFATTTSTRHKLSITRLSITSCINTSQTPSSYFISPSNTKSECKICCVFCSFVDASVCWFCLEKLALKEL